MKKGIAAILAAIMVLGVMLVPATALAADEGTFGVDYLLYGDVDKNEKINAADALTVLKAAVGKVALTEPEVILADVNGDEKVNAADALLILKFAVGKISTFPAGVKYPLKGTEPEPVDPPTIDSHLSLAWTPGNDIPGSAAGEYVLALDDKSSFGAYDICYADNNGVLTDYAPITNLKLAKTDTATATYKKLIDQNVLPAEATRIVAVRNGEIKAVTKILEEKRFRPGELLYTHAIFSDVHVFENKADSNNGFDELPVGLETVRNMGVDFLSVTGDFIMDAGADSGLATREFAEVQAIINQFNGFTINVCKGNHDKVLSQKEWTSFWGHDMDYSFTHKGETFIYLSLLTASNIGSNDTVAYGDEKIEWLAQEMKKAAGNRIYLFMHYPLPGYAGLIPGSPYGFTTASTEDDRILELVKKYDNTYVFSGHTHYDFAAQDTYKGISVTPIEGTQSYTVHVPSLAYPRISASATAYSESQGYYAEVYEKGIVLKGIDFKKNGKFIPTGCFYLESEKKPYRLSDTAKTIPVGKTDKLEILGEAYTGAKWESSDSGIVKVDGQGNLTAVAPGEATVTVLVGDYTLRAKITVEAPPPVLLPETLTLGVGESGSLGLSSKYTAVSYASSDDTVALVSTVGGLSAKKAGNATVTVTVDGTPYTVAVTVLDAPARYTGSGTLADPYRIDTATQFVTMQKDIVSGKTFSGKYFLQTADLDLNFCADYQPMTAAAGGTFSGTYNGNGYVLKVKTNTVTADFAPPYFWLVNGTIANVGFDLDFGGCASTSYGVCRQLLSGGKMYNCYLVGSLSAANANTTLVSGTADGGLIDNMFAKVTLSGAEPGPSSGVSVKGSNTVNHFYFVENGCAKRYGGEIAVTEDALSTLAPTLSANAASLSVTNIKLCSWLTKDGLPVMAHDGGYQQ